MRATVFKSKSLFWLIIVWHQECFTGVFRPRHFRLTGRQVCKLFLSVYRIRFNRMTTPEPDRPTIALIEFKVNYRVTLLAMTNVFHNIAMIRLLNVSFFSWPGIDNRPSWLMLQNTYLLSIILYRQNLRKFLIRHVQETKLNIFFFFFR